MTSRAGRIAVTAALVLAALLAAHYAASAASPFGIATPDTKGTAFTGPFGGFFSWVSMRQTAFYKLLTGAMDELGKSGHAFWLLAGVSFLYGIFHAAGPGHGKAVITSYLLVSRQAARRGILVAFAASFLQGFTAIAVVLVAAVVLRATAMGLTRATDWFAILSYALIAAVGAWLVWAKATGRGHAHFHADALGAQPRHARGHDHSDRRHAPDPRLLSRPVTVARAWSAILAVGVRPCSGAIIVLVFALSQKLLPAGIASVLVMSLGTSITVSALVVLAVSAKDVALRFANADSATTERVMRALEMVGALIVMLFGLTLLGGALADGLP
jgi:ABC-type nickel/cobalt efflux system permease component RcnA